MRAVRFQELFFSLFISFLYVLLLFLSLLLILFFSLSLSLLFSVSIGSPTLSDFLCTTEKIHRVTELDLYQKTLCFICFTQCKWFKLLFLFIISSSTRIESYWVWNRVNFFNRMISFFFSWVECVLPIFVVEFFVAFENKNRVIFCAYRAIYDELYTTEFRLFSSNKMKTRCFDFILTHRTNWFFSTDFTISDATTVMAMCIFLVNV